MSTESSNSSSTPAPAAPADTTSTAPTSEAPKSLIGSESAASATAAAPAAEGWKEYVNDDSKTPEENAALKLEHDKGKPVSAEAKPAAPAPITVEQIKLPEGFSVDDATMTPFLELMNDQKLSRGELAQKLVDLQTSSFKTAEEARSKAWDDMTAKWIEEVKSDPEVGGAKFDTAVATGNAVAKQFGDAEFLQLCETTGIGYHKSFVRFLNKVAAFTREGGVVSGDPAATAPKTLAEVMYPNQGKS